MLYLAMQPERQMPIVTFIWQEQSMINLINTCIFMKRKLQSYDQFIFGSEGVGKVLYKSVEMADFFQLIVIWS